MNKLTEEEKEYFKRYPIKVDAVLDLLNDMTEEAALTILTAAMVKIDKRRADKLGQIEFADRVWGGIVAAYFTKFTDPEGDNNVQ